MSEINDFAGIAALVGSDGRPTLEALTFFGDLVQAVRDLRAENEALRADLDAAVARLDTLDPP